VRLRGIAVLCPALVLPEEIRLNARSSPKAQNAAAEGAPLIDSELEGLFARCALYPDPLVAQVLASTYPLEGVDASRWLKNSGLKGEDLVRAAAKLEGPEGSGAVTDYLETA